MSGRIERIKIDKVKIIASLDTGNHFYFIFIFHENGIKVSRSPMDNEFFTWGCGKSDFGETLFIKSIEVNAE